MSYPSEYYHYDESELTAVINTVTDEIVLIPLNNPIVQDVAVIIHGLCREYWQSAGQYR